MTHSPTTLLKKLVERLQSIQSLWQLAVFVGSVFAALGSVFYGLVALWQLTAVEMTVGVGPFLGAELLLLSLVTLLVWLSLRKERAINAARAETDALKSQLSSGRARRSTLEHKLLSYIWNNPESPANYRGSVSKFFKADKALQRDIDYAFECLCDDGYMTHEHDMYAYALTRKGKDYVNENNLKAVSR